jgi:hypothetical protein
MHWWETKTNKKLKFEMWDLLISLVVLLRILSCCSAQDFNWNVGAGATNESVTNLFRTEVSQSWGISTSKRLCSQRSPDNSFIAPSTSTYFAAIERAGSFEVTLSTGEGATRWDAVSVFVGEWAAFTLNDKTQTRGNNRSCDEQVCILFGTNFEFSLAMDALSIGSVSTVTFAASWSFSNLTAKKADEIKFYVNGVLLGTSFPPEIQSESRPSFEFGPAAPNSKRIRSVHCVLSDELQHLH